MAKRTFSIGSAISYGWKQTTSNFKLLLIVLVIVFVSNMIPGIAAGIFDEQRVSFLGFAARLIGWGTQLTVSLGLINVALRLHDRKKTSYKNLFDCVNLVIPYLVGSIIYGVIVVVGLILLVVPGIIWAIKFKYFSYIMVDDNIGPIDALKKSSQITDGVKWKLFFFGLVLILLNFAGTLALIVGLLLTVPLTMMAEAHVYRKLRGN